MVQHEHKLHNTKYLIFDKIVTYLLMSRSHFAMVFQLEVAVSVAEASTDALTSLSHSSTSKNDFKLDSSTLSFSSQLVPCKSFFTEPFIICVLRLAINCVVVGFSLLPQPDLMQPNKLSRLS